MREQPVSASRWLAPLSLLPLLALSACNRGVLDPQGDIALQQRDIIYVSTGLMLLIIVPVIALTIVFAWRYRASNRDATYDPDFDHSTSLELLIWSAPLLIIICLGALTWWSTHLLDPFRPLDRVAAGRPIDPKQKPLHVQVVSLDWKWLFIYPEQGIATVNELAVPVDRQVRFDMTSTNMMNTFYAPTMAGMIYTMPGMRSTLHAVLNKAGTYEGLSGNYSGAGFSDMRFKLLGVDQAGFDRWVAQAKSGGRTLDTRTFLALERPSEKVPPMYFASVDQGLFNRIYLRCVKPGSSCMSGMHGGGMEMPKPALFKEGDEKGSGPNVTKPRAPEPPGSTKPESQHNRDMSLNLHDGTPGTPRVLAA
jgi:cytochrome o ubiquinol oxidase subunit II